MNLKKIILIFNLLTKQICEKLSFRQNQTTFGSSKEAHFRQRRPIFPRLSHFWFSDVRNNLFMFDFKSFFNRKRPKSREPFSEHPS